MASRKATFSASEAYLVFRAVFPSQRETPCDFNRATSSRNHCSRQSSEDSRKFLASKVRIGLSPISTVNMADVIPSRTTVASTRPQFGHSNTRFSQEAEEGVITVKFVKLRHLAQCGRSTGQSNTSVNGFSQVMRKHIGGHSHGDAAGAIDQQLRKTGGKNGRFGE